MVRDHCLILNPGKRIFCRFSKKLKMIVLARQDWILRLANESEIKEDWQYRLIDKSEEYCLIDYDAEKAQPIVKSILNDLNLFPELRILKQIRLIIIWLSTLSTILLFSIIFFKPDKDFIIDTIATINQNTPQKRQTIPEKEIEKSIIDKIWQTQPEKK